MVWVVTIAAFLATVVAALLVFLIVSQKDQIKKALKERRKEERTRLEIELELGTPPESSIYEKFSTENTSRHGARVVSSKRWQPREHVLVRMPFKREPSRARITYCDALPGDAFAVGLKFSLPVQDWLVSDDDVSSNARPYRK